MPRLALISLLGVACLALACTDDETSTASGGGSPQGGMGGVADGGGGSGATGGTGAQGGGGTGGVGGAGGGGGQGGQGGGCVNTLPNEQTPPATLSATGLYSNIATQEIASNIQAYAPLYPLWTDAAVKSRWIYLPECDPVIDNSDEDDWQFPVGTRVWKQFERDGELIETRMIHRWGAGADDFIYVAYRWNASDDEATRLIDGELDAKGTEHDIPAESQCSRCHGAAPGPGGTPSRILSFSAIQLSHSNAGATMASLSNAGQLSVPNASGYAIPGNATEQAALGYLHSNCGSCHNGTSEGWLAVPARMRIKTSDTAVNTTEPYLTLVDVAPNQFNEPSCNKLIDPNDVDNSCVLFRMKARGPDTAPGNQQMPPLGTQDPDTSGGVLAVENWINNELP